MKHLLYFVVIAATMMILSRSLPGFHVDGWTSALLAAVVLAVVNTIVRPIVKLLTLPIWLLTFGLFLLVINAAMLGLTAWIVPGVHADGFLPLFLGSLILSAVGMVWNGITKDAGKDKDHH